MSESERPRKMAKMSHGASGEAQDEAQGEAQASGSMGSVSNGSTPPTTEAAESSSPNVVEKRDNQNGTADNHVPVNDAIAPSKLSRGGEDGETVPLSKNALKKLLKKQEWESKREDRKVFRKQKAAARKERKRNARQQEEAALGSQGESVPQPHLTRPQPSRLPVTFMIDCDFDELMRDNERISLAAQITRSYSDIKNSSLRADLAICSYGGHLKDRFENILTHHKKWRGVRWLTEDFVEASQMSQSWMRDETAGYAMKGSFAKYATEDAGELERLKSEGEIVYLSSESDETLTELKPYSTYIIGGLVDKNREKGLCHRRAVQRGLRTARLPIGEFLELQSRKVLATNHVNEIMVRWLECGDWGEAFMKVIPKRKGGTLKEKADGGDVPNVADEDIQESEP